MSLFSSATVSGVKDDARHLAESAVEAARERVVDPAIDAARHARERVIEPAVDAARDAMKHTRDFISNQSTQFQRAATDGRDRLSHWVSENPFSALGAAFAAGLICSSLFRINQR
ncbi:MAG: hypothetical protein ACR2OZ_04130 [Verrucomicrobiales bacterium]